jgi:sugar lactone lactonase YvrE
MQKINFSAGEVSKKLSHFNSYVQAGLARTGWALLTKLLLLSVLLFSAVANAYAAPLAPAAIFAGVQSNVGSGWTSPTGVATDRAGNIYVAEENQIVEISAATGAQTVVLNEGLSSPTDVVVDQAGNIYISDTEHSRIVKIPNGGAAQDMHVQGLVTPQGLALDAAGNLFIADDQAAKVVKVPVNGGPQTTIGTGLVAPNWVAVDKAGDVYITDSGLGEVVEVLANGSQMPVDLGSNIAGAIAFDDIGNLFFDNPNLNSVQEKLANGSGIETVLTGIGGLLGLAIDNAGRLYVADLEAANSRIVELQTRSIDFGNVPVCPTSGKTIKACGTTVTFNVNLLWGAGSSAQALTLGVLNEDYRVTDTICGTFSKFSYSCSYTVLFTPRFAGVRQGAFEVTNGAGGALLLTVPLRGVGTAAQAAFTALHDVPVAYPGPQLPNGVAVDGIGNIYYVNDDSLIELPANGGAPVTLASVSDTGDLAIDGAGNVYTAAGYPSHVYRVDAVTHAVSDIGSGFNFPTGIAVDAFSNVYVSEFYGQDVVEIPADGGPQSVVAAGFTNPGSIAIDASGDLFVVDYGARKVFEVPAGFGATTEIGADWASPFAVRVDAAGDVFVVQSNNQLYEVPAGGEPQRVITTLTSSEPGYLAIAPNGNLFVTSVAGLFEVPRSQPPTLAFASTAVGSTSADSAQIVDVESVGNQPLNVTYVAVPTDFSLETSALGDASLCTASSVMAPGNLCALPIAFTPQEVGSLSEAVVIADNTLNGNTAQSIDVSGTGLVSASSFTLSSASLAFGSSKFGVAALRTQTVTVTNGGTASISIGSVKLIDRDVTSFSMATTCAATLAAHSTCSITVGFKPAAVGSLTAAVAITDNVAGSPQLISLSGTGTGVTTVALSATNLAFGTVAVNLKSATRIVTLENTGAATLSIVSFASTGTIAEFPTTTTCGKSLAPKVSCTLSIHFAPTKAGAVKAAIEINDDASTSPQVIELGGTGQ